MTQEITREIALEKLRELVAEKGEDFVYRPPGEYGECMYAEVKSVDENGEVTKFTPSCGVGWVIDSLDKDLFLVVAKAERNLYDSFGVGAIFGSHDGEYIHYSHPIARGRATEGAKAVLAAFQMLQDRSMPYGKCLEYVENLDPKVGYREANKMATEFGRSERLRQFTGE